MPKGRQTEMSAAKKLEELRRCGNHLKFYFILMVLTNRDHYGNSLTSKKATLLQIKAYILFPYDLKLL
jgi:uncharacterized membrane protein YkvA (DUF1232 family)